MYIKLFTWIIYFDNIICYTKNPGLMIILKFSQRDGKLPLPQKNSVITR